MLTKLFPFLKPKPKPLPELIHPVFGALVWSADEEGWKGEFNGFHIILDYEKQEAPTDELVSLANSFLSNSDTIYQTINTAKQRFKDSGHEQCFQEVDDLNLSEISLFRKGVNLYAFLLFSGGLQERHWKIDYFNGVWGDLGFDD